jgi:competence protein ComEC
MKNWSGKPHRKSSHLNKYIEAHQHFWREHPALFYSLTLLIGTSAPLFFDHYVWPLLWLGYSYFCRSIPQVILLAASLIYGSFTHISDPPTQEINAIFSPHSLQPNHSPFQKGLLYKGTLKHDTASIPCSIYIRGNASLRPIANQNYVVQGQIQQRGPYDFVFKAKEWKPIPHTWGMAELRYKTKEKFKTFLSTHLSSGRVSTFLSSITTGDVEDRILRYEFGRIGLQHILAISGFHFGILIGFLTFFLRLFLSHAAKTLALFFIVSAYYIFIGSSPAVERSYLTALFYLIGKWTNRPTSGLNLLGCAMGVELIWDPLVAHNMGFQLSFLSCFAILFFYPFIEKKLRTFFPKRTWAEIQLLTLPSQHGYLFSSFFRKAISLNLAVNIVLLPLLLFHFHQFPYLSLIYNLFFPFFIGLSITLLLTAFVFHFLFPPIATCLFYVTNSFTDFLLDMTSNPPLPLDFSLKCANVSATFVILYLFLLGFCMISSRRKSPQHIYF